MNEFYMRYLKNNTILDDKYKAYRVLYWEPKDKHAVGFNVQISNAMTFKEAVRFGESECWEYGFNLFQQID